MTTEEAAPVRATDDLTAHARYLQQRRMPALDGIRAIAVLLVVTAHPAYRHVWPLLHGTYGVTIFFVLSGFLITTLLLREQSQRGSVDLVGFYTRRLFRIYPTFFLVLALYCVLIFVVGMSPDRRAAFQDNLPWMVLLFPEHSIFFNHAGVEVPFNASWSIGIEEKYYLVWPVLGFVLLARRPRWRIVALLAAVAAAAVLNSAFDWGVVVVCYGQLALGSLTAVLLHDRRTFSVLRPLGDRRLLWPLAAGFVAFHLLADEARMGGSLYLVYGLWCALLLVGVVLAEPARAETGWLSSRFMVYTGELSYVLYLIHNFGLNAAEAVLPSGWGFPGSVLSTVVGLGLAYLAAHVIHIAFENPLRRYGARLARRRSATRTG